MYISINGGVETLFEEDDVITLNEGTAITIRADATSPYVFSYWTGIGAFTETYTFTLDDDYEIGAVFIDSSGILYTLTGGVVTGDGNMYVSINGGTEMLFEEGDVITLDDSGITVTFTVRVATGAEFINWTDDLSLYGDTVPVDLLMDDDYVVGAEFTFRPVRDITSGDSDGTEFVLVLVFVLLAALLAFGFIIGRNN